VVLGREVEDAMHISFDHLVNIVITTHSQAQLVPTLYLL
jgi:hypothetical protein